jgi:hypothetical protein
MANQRLKKKEKAVIKMRMIRKNQTLSLRGRRQQKRRLSDVSCFYHLRERFKYSLLSVTKKATLNGNMLNIRSLAIKCGDQERQKW